MQIHHFRFEVVGEFLYNVRTSKQGTATISITFEISSKEELQKIAEKLYQVESVMDVERATG